MNVKVINPADEFGSPAYDGPAREAHTGLKPGAYTATDEDGAEYALLVGTTHTIVAPVIDIDHVHTAH